MRSRWAGRSHYCTVSLNKVFLSLPTRHSNLKSSTSRWKKYLNETKQVLQLLWSAYSSPTPSGWKQLLVLLLLCLCISTITSGLLYNWLLSSLKYKGYVSKLITGVFIIIMFLLLFLVHPVRCAFTIVVPTLGTKQGRDLFLSTCFMLVAINIIPNIMGNMKMVLKLLECVAMTSVKSLGNSTSIVSHLKDKLVEELQKLQELEPFVLQHSDTKWELNSDINQSAIQSQLQTIGKDIQSEFDKIHTLISEITLYTNRALAAFIFFYLAFTSIWYLKGYLTNLEFDNVYITGKLTDLLQPKRGWHVPKRTASKKLIRSTGLKMSSDEIAACVKQMVISTAYLAISAIIIIADFVIFSFTSEILRWTVDIPPVHAVLGFEYKVTIGTPVEEIVNSMRTWKNKTLFSWNFTFTSDRCVFRASPPDIHIICVVSLLYFIVYITVFLEAYALRARRKISASFFESRENKRVKYLQQKLLNNLEHQFKNNVVVFTVSEQCHVSFKRQCLNHET
ncbi:osteoclast stimulatory transmembrane protein isoform X1 [Hypanus sabinus]|uniref:osteoclast stimulatory transmembrane protein isoform X1 n=1 Tax=Hypanus sabinus TaxID=79690 RepID=UPI0028C47A92|nr:osteoclast stimulatory transmembrane protein isoform X1 [Hypanus sabinus]